MSAAAQETDNAARQMKGDGGPSEHGPAVFAPRTARGPNRAPPLLLPRTESRPDPPWRPGPSAALPSGVGPMELGRISPKKLIVVVPPAPPPARSFGATTWFSFVGGALIAGAVGGYLVGYAQRIATPEQSSSVAEAEQAIPATEAVASREIARTPTSTPHLTVAAARVLRADEPAQLAISYWNAGLNVSVVIDGLASGSALEAGTPAAPNAWRLADADLKGAVIRPPPGFLGVMNLTLELRLADDTVVDRQTLQLEWEGEAAPAPTVSAEPSLRHPDASEFTFLMKRGAELMANRDISAARMMFQRAAETGDPRAALALAETYDPLVLDKLGATGIKPDIALARQWYEKAEALGSTVAPKR
jgi:hypothetical protein